MEKFAHSNTQLIETGETAIAWIIKPDESKNYKKPKPKPNEYEKFKNIEKTENGKIIRIRKVVTQSVEKDHQPKIMLESTPELQ